MNDETHAIIGDRLDDHAIAVAREQGLTADEAIASPSTRSTELDAVRSHPTGLPPIRWFTQ
jgi:hypothetical protein